MWRCRLEREKDMSAEDAVREASHQRLRPILMTTACAALGGIPMILMNGTGAEFRQPLGYAIVGGLGGVADAHAFHHAGGLYLSRSLAELARPSGSEQALSPAE